METAQERNEKFPVMRGQMGSSRGAASPEGGMRGNARELEGRQWQLQQRF